MKKHLTSSTVFEGCGGAAPDQMGVKTMSNAKAAVEKCPRCTSPAVFPHKHGWIRGECGNPNCGIGPEWGEDREGYNPIQVWNDFAKAWPSQPYTQQAIANGQRDSILRDLVADLGKVMGKLTQLNATADRHTAQIERHDAKNMALSGRLDAFLEGLGEVQRRVARIDSQTQQDIRRPQ